jgi:hypothetical protein
VFNNTILKPYAREMRLAPALAVWIAWTSVLGVALGTLASLASGSPACVVGTCLSACAFALVSLCARWAVSWPADLITIGTRAWRGGAACAESSDAPCLVLLHPHGLCVGMTILCHGLDGLSRSTRSKRARPCAVSALGALSGLAQFGWLEIRPGAVAAHMARRRDVLIYPGGHRECAQHDHARDIANVGSRGAIRLALVHGYDVRVAYAFGERSVAVNVPGMRTVRAWLAAHRVPAIVPIPTRAALDARAVRVAVSAPCAFPTIRDPTEADVAHWHARYVAELHDLHAEFRSANDPPLTLV